MIRRIETATSVLVNRQFADAVGQILSLRGDKLTVLLEGRKHTAGRSGKMVWVVRAGSQPRAWCKRDAPAGKTSDHWREARFPCDALLVHPDACRAAMAELVSILRASQHWHLTMAERFDFDAANQELGRRTVALARSRRLVRELRAAGEFAGMAPNEQRENLAQIRRDCGVWEFRPEEGSAELLVSVHPHPAEPAEEFHRFPEAREMFDEVARTSSKLVPVSNKTLLSRRRLIRLWLRLNWLRQWLLRFPDEAMELLEQPFTSRRWHLLSLWLRVPASRDLCRDIPALAYVMASAHAFRKTPVHRPLRSLRTLVQGRRKRLLVWLGFPASPLTLRFMRLITPQDLTMELSFDLRRVTQAAPSHAAELIRRGQSVDHRTLRLIVPPILPTMALLREMLLHGTEEQSLWLDSVRIARRLHDAGGHLERLPRIKSLAALRQTHDRLLALHRTQSQQIPDSVREKFPITAPVAGIPGIIPLTALDDVIAEAVRMNHCLDTYIVPMAAGNYIAYAIHRDEEYATLGLCKTADGWSIDQLQGPNNSVVSDKLRQYVNEWRQHWFE